MKKIVTLFFLLSIISVSPALALVLSPTDDAYVFNSYDPTLNTVNTGSLNNMLIKSYVGSYFQFDLSSYLALDSAKLWFYTWESNGISTVDVLSVLNNWDETTLTGINQPLKTGAGVFNNVIVRTGWVCWDVTSLAQLASGNLFSLDLITTSTIIQRIYSKEYADASLRPYLEITESAPAPEPAPAPVPEPSTLLLLSGGLAALGWYGRRRKSS